MIKNIAIATVAAGILAAPAAFAIQPSAVPETGTVENAPAGSLVTIKDQDKFGSAYENIYRVNEDGSLRLVNQFATGD